MRLIAAERVVLFCSLVLMACSQSGGVSPAPSPTGDESRTVSEYVALGVPDPGRGWSGKDVEECASVLVNLPASQLPRLRSARSSALFRRMVAEINPTPSERLPFVNRLADVLLASQATIKLLDKYVLAAGEGMVVDVEIAELAGVTMQQNLRQWELADEVWLGLTAAQRTERQSGLDQMRSGTAQIIEGIFVTLSETEAFGLESRRLLASAAERFVPKMWNRIPAESKREMKLKLEGLIRETADPALLRSFRTLEAQLHNPK